MKKISLLKSAFLLFAAGSLVVSCSKDDDNDSQQGITEEEAAEVAQRSVDPASGGVVAQLNTSVTIAASASFLGPANCGVQKTNNYSGSSTQGATISYAYSYGWNWTLTCAGTQPQRFDFAYSGSAGYDGPRIATSGSTAATANITGLESSASQYVVNTSYEHNGNTTSKIGNKNSFTSKVQISSANINIDKVTRKIQSGSAAVTITGSTTQGSSFNYNGTIVFNGNNTATVTLNSNQTYAVQW